MPHLLPTATGSVGRSLQSLLEHLEPELCEPVATVFVDCGDRGWLRYASGTPEDQRRRSVIAAAADSTLVAAIRLGIGGAVSQPVSTPALTAAFEAAAEPLDAVFPLALGGGGLEALLGTASRVHAVGWFPRGFWLPLIGRRLAALELTRFENALGGPTAVIDWPALVIADGDADRLNEVVGSGCWRRDEDCGIEPMVVEASRCLDADDPVSALIADLDGADAAAAATGETSLSVFELPTGRPIGSWAPSGRSGSDPERWSAYPVRATPTGHRWRFEAADGHVDEIEDLPGQTGWGPERPFLRVPGWIGAELGPGRPAGILVERLAGDLARNGRPLWVSNVTREGVRWLLGLPPPIWVDGPGVPG